jgi:hypothetical protein
MFSSFLVDRWSTSASADDPFCTIHRYYRRAIYRCARRCKSANLLIQRIFDFMRMPYYWINLSPFLILPHFLLFYILHHEVIRSPILCRLALVGTLFRPRRHIISPSTTDFNNSIKYSEWLNHLVRIIQ